MARPLASLISRRSESKHEKLTKFVQCHLSQFVWFCSQLLILFGQSHRQVNFTGSATYDDEGSLSSSLKVTAEDLKLDKKDSHLWLMIAVGGGGVALFW